MAATETEADLTKAKPSSKTPGATSLTTAATEPAKPARWSSGPGVGAFAYAMSCSSSEAISAFKVAFSVTVVCSLRMVSRVANFSASSAAVADAARDAAASEAEREEASRDSASASRASSAARAEEDSASCGKGTA